MQSKSKRTKGRQIYLGGYDDEITAARTYDKAALAYLGPRAPTNVSFFVFFSVATLNAMGYFLCV